MEPLLLRECSGLGPPAVPRLLRYDVHGSNNSTSLSPGSETASHSTDTSLFCRICMNTGIPEKEMFSLPCRHWFCRDCLSGYISSKVTSDEWKVACPQGASCTCIIPLDATEFLCSPDVYKRLRGNMLTSFIEDKQGKTRALYCKNPKGCDGILLLADDSDHTKVRVCGILKCYTYI